MAAIERDGITGQQSAHETGQFKAIAAQQEMEMIGDQSPGKTVGFSFDKKAAEAGKKLITVIIVQKNFGPFNASYDDVLQEAGDIESGLSRHGREDSKKRRLKQ
jgi:hypothetical protein